jgi:hypothetical protein
LPPAVVAPAYVPPPEPTTITTTNIPTGKYKDYESRLGIVVHDGLEFFTTARAYTRCDPTTKRAEIFVAPAILPQDEKGVILHEYGHVLECRAGWGSDTNSQRGEMVADAVSIRLGGFATYGHNPDADVFNLADILLREAARNGVNAPDSVP